MSTEDLATHLMDDIDSRLLDFIRTRVNSFIKWDLVRFFHDNPHTTDTTENIARYTGRESAHGWPRTRSVGRRRTAPSDAAQ